jgi:predicted transcriptional regulator
MGAVGSYVLSIQEKNAGREIDLETASARILKLLGARPLSLGDLLSSTGFPEPVAIEAIGYLRSRELVTEQDGRLTLTPLGYKAHLIVAA